MTRRLLVWVIAALAALLSFDTLRAYALNGGVIPNHTILARPLLAAGWAICIDLAAAAGILGIRHDRHDWRAWAMFLLAAVASVGFQVFTLPAILARAVPPVALFLAIVVLELPRARPVEVPVLEDPHPLGPGHQPEPAPRTRRHRPLTSAELVKVEPLVKQGRKAYGIAQELGIPYPVVRQHMRDQELVSTNGHGGS